MVPQTVKKDAKKAERKGLHSEQEITRLMHRTGISRNAVRNWSRGEKVLDRTRRDLDRAARALRIVVPEGRANTYSGANQK